MSDNEAAPQEETKRKRGRPSKTGGEVKVRNLTLSSDTKKMARNTGNLDPGIE
jgi:hypothetical protein